MEKASDIPKILIKKSAKLISPLLAKLYNNCTDAGIFPQILKLVKSLLFLRKEIKNSWRTTGQFLSCHFLVKFSKKSYTTGFTTSSPKKMF